MPTTAAPTLDLGHEQPDALLAFFKGHAESNVEIDLSKTGTLSGRHIEILLAAHRQWTTAGLAIGLTHVNETLLQQLIVLGLPTQLLPEGT